MLTTRQMWIVFGIVVVSLSLWAGLVVKRMQQPTVYAAVFQVQNLHVEATSLRPIEDWNLGNEELQCGTELAITSKIQRVEIAEVVQKVNGEFVRSGMWEMQIFTEHGNYRLWIETENMMYVLSLLAEESSLPHVINHEVGSDGVTQLQICLPSQ